MPLIKLNHPDCGAEISREMEYQQKRGLHPSWIEISPEVHEAMRLQVKASSGSRLREHDGLPVQVNRRMIGVKAWRVHYEEGAPMSEKQVDALRLGGRIQIATH